MNRRPKKAPFYLEDLGDSLLDEHDPLGRGLFLGRLNDAQLEQLFEDSGLVAAVHAKGYQALKLARLRQDDVSRLYLTGAINGHVERLIELSLREACFRPRQAFVPGFEFADGLSVLEVQWLCLQNPQAAFCCARPPLPGQASPGLGCLRQMQAFLLELAHERDAVLNMPERYHTAAIYAEEYHFYAPAAAGQLQAMRRDLADLPLQLASEVIEHGCLVSLDTNEAVAWQPSEQLCPISDRMKAYFVHPVYRAAAAESARRLRYAVDWVQYERIKDGAPLNE